MSEKGKGVLAYIFTWMEIADGQEKKDWIID